MQKYNYFVYPLKHRRDFIEYENVVSCRRMQKITAKSSDVFNISFSNVFKTRQKKYPAIYSNYS